MNVKQQLAYNINIIICSYNETKNIRRFYKKISKLNNCIYKNISHDLYQDHKIDFDRMYSYIIINGEDDDTIINDCINNLRKILLKLLLFE